MSGPFDGRDLLVGEIAAVRTFDLRSDGSLWPVFSADRAWSAGDNEATCARHEVAGAPGCKCGFWAYGSAPALRDQPAGRDVAAVVSCWGRVTPGTRGLRSQYARVDAIWLSPRVASDLVALVGARYPHADLFRDRAAMLEAHPLTVLPSYRLPDRRPARLLTARLVLQALMTACLLVGLLPRADLRTWWLSQLHTQLTQMLAYCVIVAMVRLVADLRTGVGRPHYVRVIVGSVSLLAWVWAPYVPLLWQVPLRAPVVLWARRVVLRRTVRFVPTRAAAPPDEQAPPAPG